MGKLNDKAVAGAKPGEKDYKLSDGDGLHLLVRTNGSKLWRLKYRIAGKEKLLSFGQYPLISLKNVRERTLEARRLLSNGIDPMEQKKAIKAASEIAQTTKTETVEVIGREWFEKFGSEWVDSHGSKVIRRMERDLFPWLGKAEIRTVTPSALLSVLRRVEARGALDTAHRLHQNCGQIWRYAVATGRVERDITSDLKGALPPAKETHLGAITDPVEVGALLRNIENYKGSEVVRFLLQLSPLLFLRPGEIRSAKWSEFPDFDEEVDEIWTIPASRMKAKRPHVVPLCKQVMAILGDLKELTGDGEYLFPSPRSKTRPLSDTAVLAALQRMGYDKGQMTAHGFRAMASTNLEQLGYDVRLIELQLAHADQDKVRAAYKRETHLLRLDERKKMMQAWADYLDGLRNGAAVLPFKKMG
ncbi:MAG: integrase [Nitrospirae bacterium CG_4_10_14_3_um_filter_44_29]|nr:MAG: integrase [Nitrospirae bacterium CG22_combo_CG10-13_8_21_14_all_44_11]PIX89526.1 MAG: integrase [Nitrospirae bacterium CG_4_10_14_3_um_filter_44_29]